MAKDITVRTRSGKLITVENCSASKAIKIHCTECLGHGEVNPKHCTSINCALYQFRGKMNITID